MNKINLKKVKRILVLNMLGKTIGDTVFLTPYFKILKKRFPKKYIAVTSSKLTKNIFDNNPYIDENIVIENLDKISKDIPKITKTFIYFKIIFDLIRRLKRKRFDLCIVIWPNFFLMQLIPKLAGIKYSVGYKYKGSYFDFLLTKKTRFKDQHKYPKRHFIESYFDLLRLIGIEPKEDERYVQIYLSNKNKKRAKRILKDNGIKEKDIIAFQGGANWESKRWPENNFAELARKILKYKPKARIILLGSPAEFDINEHIKELAGNKLINLAGKISLDDVPAIINESRLIIGNDSGLMHIAAGVKTPCIVVYGSTNPKHSKPLGKEVYIVFKNDFCKPCITNKKDCKYDFKCMKMIKADDVMKEVKKVIK